MYGRDIELERLGAL